MAKLRAAVCYRRPKRPHTRVSKYRELSYVKGVPGSKIVKFETGVTNGNFTHKIELISKTYLQIRHNALESARIAANRYLEKIVGKDNYHLKIKLYPHQVMRHNPKANFAGADRFQDGMAHPYGKPLGRAAIVKVGQGVLYARVNENYINAAKIALKRAGDKLPCRYKLEITKAGN